MRRDSAPGTVALLRGVNLGKRQLKMADLKRIGVELGLDQPRTYIASGNLLFRSGKSEAALTKVIKTALEEHMGAKVGVMIRTAGELAEVAAANPFAEQPGNRVVAFFLDQPAPATALVEARNVDDEQMALGKREIYVHYPRGIGRSKLRVPATAQGTARNMNTIAKLAKLAEEMR